MLSNEKEWTNESVINDQWWIINENEWMDDEIRMSNNELYEL